MPSSPGPQSIDFSRQNIVGVSTNDFTGQQQIQDWQAHWMEASLVLPPMVETQAALWIDFLMSCNGIANVFQLPAFTNALVPASANASGYWQLKTNLVKWSISDAMLYGIQFEIREVV